MYCVVCGMMHIITHCCSNRFPLPYVSIPYNSKSNKLNVSLNKTFHSLLLQLVVSVRPPLARTRCDWLTGGQSTTTPARRSRPSSSRTRCYRACSSSSPRPRPSWGSSGRTPAPPAALRPTSHRLKQKQIHLSRTSRKRQVFRGDAMLDLWIWGSFHKAVVATVDLSYLQYAKVVSWNRLSVIEKCEHHYSTYFLLW